MNVFNMKWGLIYLYMLEIVSLWLNELFSFLFVLAYPEKTKI